MKVGSEEIKRMNEARRRIKKDYVPHQSEEGIPEINLMFDEKEFVKLD